MYRHLNKPSTKFKMLKLLLALSLMIPNFTSNAQVDTGYWGLIFGSEFLLANQKKSPLLPADFFQDDYPLRVFLNHQLMVQYSKKVRPRIEINAALGFNYQYYSVQSKVTLENIANFLGASEQLSGAERDFDLFKIRRNNFFLSAPIGLNLFLKKDVSADVQPAFSLQFMAERRLVNFVNSVYVTEYHLLSKDKVYTSSIDSSIEDFYKKQVPNMLFNLRIGMSLQFRRADNGFNSLDLKYIHYFNSFDSDITEAPRGMSCSFRVLF